MKRILFIVSEDRYFLSHRMHLATSALEKGYQVALLSKISEYEETLKSSGIEVINWSLQRRSSNPLLEIRAIWQIFVAVRNFAPDLVHAVALKPVLYSSLICKLAGVKSRVFALGGLGFVFSSEKKLARTLRPFIIIAFRLMLGGKGSRLIVQNPDDLNKLLKLNAIKKEHTYLIRGAGVDTQVFYPQPEQQRAPIILLPARLLWDKGIGEFAAAARALREKNANLRFIVIGDPDPHNPECIPMSTVNEWVKEGIIEAWGYQNDMHMLINQALIVCLPSYREGLPKVLLEAASCGRPIVTNDVPGCREVVVDGINGILVPPKDIAALTTALDKLINDQDLRVQMGKEGRKKVLQEFSQEIIADETIRVWEEALC